MSEIMGLCGYRCDLCPAYNDNIKNKNNRQKISEGWKRYFKSEVPPEKIGCVGCINEGKHTEANCSVRPCVLEKKVENCAYCDDFICEDLRGRVEYMEELLEKCANNLSEEDYRLFFQPYLNRSWLLNTRDKTGRNEPNSKR